MSKKKDGKTTILRVRRVTHGEETRTKEVPFGTQTIIDPNLQPGEVTVRQEGENGEIQQTYAVTYVDGVKESETLTGEDHENRHRQSHCGRTGKNYGRYRQIRQIRQQRQRQQQRR